MPTSSKHTTHNTPRLAEKTVQELRVLAKSLGLTKYSKLTKAQLQRQIAAAAPVKKRVAKSKVAVKNPKKEKAVRPAAKAAAPTTRKPRAPARHAPPLDVDRITSASTSISQEDDTPVPAKKPLPPLHAAPMLTLRGQQPGVLHAAWSIDPSRSMPLPYLRLRILKVSASNSTLVDEVPLPDMQGSRYFHLATESGDSPLRAEIGYHSSDGRFIVMHWHTDVRLPGRHAAGRGDPQWWISEADFSELYLRSGGLSEGSALVWHTSFSSR